jgi:hypothetical protein
MQDTVAYSAVEWSAFFSAEVAASAALAGLLFVSISINLAQILANPNLPPRAAKAVTTLVRFCWGPASAWFPVSPRECSAQNCYSLASELGSRSR